MVPLARAGAAPTTGSAAPSFVRVDVLGLFDFLRVRVLGHACKPERVDDPKDHR